MSTRKKPKAKRVTADLPDLTDIYYAFDNAHALVQVACDYMTQTNDTSGSVISVLIQGVDALDRVAVRFKEAEEQFRLFRRRGTP
jgi:hypothetical protein